MPTGPYFSGSRGERVIVLPTMLIFDFKIEEEGRVRRVVKPCNYKVLPDGRIWTRLCKYEVLPDGRYSTNGYGSGEYAPTFEQFAWFWDGKRIIRVSSSKDGKPRLLRFERLAEE